MVETKTPFLQTERNLIEGVVLEWQGPRSSPLPYDLLTEAVVNERRERQERFPNYRIIALEATERERDLVDAVVAYKESLRGVTRNPLPYECEVDDVLVERQEQARKHPEYRSLGYRFLSLPWRRQVMVLERVGLLRDPDPPLTGHDLFQLIFPRALERGGLRHLRIMVDFEREHLGLEHKTAAAPDPISSVTDEKG